MRDLLALRVRPPRLESRYPAWGRLRCIGLLIDWLDSRPEHSAKDNAALERKAMRGDMIALAAAVVTRRLGLEWAKFEGPIDHTGTLGTTTSVTMGKSPDTWLSTKSRSAKKPIDASHDVLPGCMSALVNLAEIERRAGRKAEAEMRLQAALEHATSSPKRRYGVANSDWSLEIRFALARLARNIGEGGPLLECARRDRLEDLIAQLRHYGSWERAAVPAHQAFSVASAEQQIVLHAAMRLAPVYPKPPAAAHSDFAAIYAVDELVQQHSLKTAGPSPALQGPPESIGSAILKILRWLRPS